MRLLERLLGRTRLVVATVLLLSSIGAVAWFRMVRQEDPRLPNFWGQVVVAYPGADAESVERMVLEPLEDALAEVSEIKDVISTAYDGFAVVIIEMRGDLPDYERAWDEVEDAARVARREFPDGVSEPEIDHEMMDPDSIVLALVGDPDPQRLLAAARRLREDLLALPWVARVSLPGSPGEQVTVALDDAAARRLGMSAAAVAAQLASRTHIVPGGSLLIGGKNVRLRPMSELGSVEEIAATPIGVPSGSAVPLSEVASVRLGRAEPVAERMRFGGEAAVGLAVVARRDINLVDFGRQVRRVVEAARGRLAPVEVHEVTFQPDRVADRLAELNRSLLMGMLIVGGLMVLLMGPRLGLVVACILPLVAFSSIAAFALGGGVLHQISIAALVITLGMLVDNAIVVAEAVQWRLDHGEAGLMAGAGAVRELAVPLAGASGTTMAAFVPMLAAGGATAAFTRSLPVVIILTLAISYLYALFFTPLVAAWALRPGNEHEASSSGRLARFLAGLAVRRTGFVLLAAAVVVALSLAGTRLVRSQFFPASDRNQFTVELRLPEGAHIEATSAASLTLERALLRHPEVTAVTAFVGRGAPKFYYNIIPVPFRPHFAQFIVEVRHHRQVEPLCAWVRAFARSELPEAEAVARRLEQGPPVGAPVEIRLFGEDLAALHRGAGLVAAVLEKTAGATDVRHDLGAGSPTVRLAIDDAAAERHGVSRLEVARAVFGRTRGIPVGSLRNGEDPIPIVVRSSAGEDLPLDDLEAIDVASRRGELIPLGQVARPEAVWRPAAVNHRDGQRVVTVSAQLAGDATYSQVLERLSPRLAALALPDGVRWTYGGDAEGSEEANTEMMKALPLGVLLLLACLLLEFNSIRRMLIILVTVPLAAAGVVPGLLLGRQPFGFMSLLGVIALVGVVVNNAILLLEVIEQRRAEGQDLDTAIGDAVSRRIRPILLTTSTTVVGLLPMVLTSATMWPPLAWAIISGLTASTLLTLIVVPALYRLAFTRRGDAGPASVASAAVLLLSLLAPATGTAQEPEALTLQASMRAAAGRAAAEAVRQRSAAAKRAATAESRLAFLPMVGGSFEAADRDRTLALDTPLGEFPFGKSRSNSAAVELRQPLFDAGRMIHSRRAARLEASAAELSSARAGEELAADAALAYLDVLAVEARIQATESYLRSLEARLAEVEARVAAGRALEADGLKLRLALDQGRQELLALGHGRDLARRALARATGKEGVVNALDAPDWLEAPPPPDELAVARALASREDLAALGATSRALDARRSATLADALPRLDGRAAWVWTNGSPYTVNDWVEGSVVVTWTPFAAGTRAARAAAYEAQRRAAEAERTDAGQGIALQVRAATASIAVARSGVAVARTGVTLATETLRVESERHSVGRATTNDLLAAQAVLREQQTRLALARLEVVRGWVRLWLAGGAALPE